MNPGSGTALKGSRSAGASWSARFLFWNRSYSGRASCRVVLRQHHVGEVGQPVAVGRADRCWAAIGVEADIAQERGRAQPVIHAQVGVAVDGAWVPEIAVRVDREVAGGEEAVDP